MNLLFWIYEACRLFLSMSFHHSPTTSIKLLKFVVLVWEWYKLTRWSLAALQSVVESTIKQRHSSSILYFILLIVCLICYRLGQATNQDLIKILKSGLGTKTNLRLKFWVGDSCPLPLKSVFDNVLLNIVVCPCLTPDVHLEILIRWVIRRSILCSAVLMKY